MMKNYVIDVITHGASLGRGCAVAVGNFDGMHLGHRAMLARVRSEADRLGLPAAVFTFDLKNTDNIKPRLACDAKKRELFRECGVDITVTAPLGELKSMPAERFVTDALSDLIGARSVVCGYDFRFGYNRVGDASLIDRMLSPSGGSVIIQGAVTVNGEAVSSTAIRALLERGDVREAAVLLGRLYSFSGEVVHGARLGRTIGTPTLNMPYPSYLAPLKYGVYAVRCRLGDALYDGVANVGIKPTVNGTDPICETYLFGFDGDCYGSVAEIFFVEFIRAEARFASLDGLSRQLSLDKASALDILKRS